MKGQRRQIYSDARRRWHRSLKVGRQRRWLKKNCPGEGRKYGEPEPWRNSMLQPKLPPTLFGAALSGFSRLGAWHFPSAVPEEHRIAEEFQGILNAAPMTVARLRHELDVSMHFDKMKKVVGFNV